MSDVVGRASLEIGAKVDLSSLNTALQSLANTAEKGVGSAINSITAGFKTFAVAGAASIGTVIGKSLELGKAFQIQQQQVLAGLSATLSGGQSQAKGLIADINSLAEGTLKFNDSLGNVIQTVKSPFPRELFFSATQQLVGFGVAAKQVIPILNAVQNAVAATGGSAQDIQQLTSVFANISAQGKLTGIDLLRLGNTGINAAQILGDKFGIAASKIKQDTSVIKASSSEIITALTEGLQAKFGSATANLTDTFEKAADKLKSSERNLGRVLVAPFIDSERGGAAVKILADIAHVIDNVTKAALPFQVVIQQLADRIVKLADSAAVLSDKLNESKVISFIDALKPLLPLLPILIGLFGNFAAKLTEGVPVLGGLLDGINPVVGALIGFVAAVPAVRDALGSFISTVAPIVANILPALEGLLTTVVNIFASTFAQALQALVPIVQLFANAIAALVPQLIPLVVEIGTLVQNLIAGLLPAITTIATAFINLIPSLVPVIEIIVQIANVLVTALVPIIQQLAVSFAQLLPSLVPLVTALGNLLLSVAPLVVLISQGLVVALQLLTPIINDVLGIITFLIQGLATLQDKFGILIPVIAGLAGAFLFLKVQAALSAAGILATQAGIVLYTAASIAATFATEGLTAGIVALETATGISEVALLVAAIVALVAIVVTAVVKIKPLRDAFFALKDIIGSGLIATFNAFKTVLVDIGSVAATVGKAVGGALAGGFGATVDVIKTVVGAVGGGLKTAFDGVSTVVSTVANVVSTVLTPVFKAVGDVISFVGDHIKAFLIPLFVALIPIIAAVGAVVLTLIAAFILVKAAVQAVIILVQAIIPVFQSLVSVIGTVIGVIGELIAAIAKVAFDVIKASVQLLVDVFKELYGVISTVVSIFLQVAEVIGKIGFDIVKASVQLLVDVFKELYGVLSVIVTVISDVAGFFLKLGDAIGGTLLGVIKSMVDGLLGLLPIGAIADGISTAISAIGDAAKAVVGFVGDLLDKLTNFGPIKAILDGVGGAVSKITGAIGGVTGAVSGAAGKVGGFFSGLFGGGKKDADDLGKSVDNVNNKFKGTTTSIQGAVDATKRAKAAQDAYNQAVAALPPTPTANIADLQSQLATATQGLQTQLDTASKQFDGVFAAGEKLKSANLAVASAQKEQTAATKRVNDLQAERLKVIRDTISPQREIINAENDLTRARFGLGNIDKQIIATEKELQDLRGQATLDKEAANDRDIERAKIALARAQRAENDLVQQSIDLKNQDNKLSAAEVNLSGLTLDQARNKLKAAQSTLKAQQDAKKVTDAKGANDPVKQAEDVKLAQLDTLDAAQKLKDTEAAAVQFKIDTAQKIQDDEQKLIDLNIQKDEQAQAIIDKQTKLNELRAGETTLATALKNIDEQIKSAKEAQAAAALRVRDAVNAAKDAEINLRIESDKITGNLTDQAALVAQQLADRAKAAGVEQGVLDKVNGTTQGIRDQIGAVEALQAALAAASGSVDAQAAAADAAVKSLLTSAHIAFGPGADTSALVAAQNDPKSIVSLLLAPGSPFREALLKILAQTFPGFALGGLVGGLAGEAGAPSSNAMGQLVRVGEYAKPELILPLTRPDRVWELLSKHLPKFPGAMKAAQAAVNVEMGNISNSFTPLITLDSPAPSISLSAPGQPRKQAFEVEHEQRMFARMIAEELVKAGFEGNVTVEAPITVETGNKLVNEEIWARQIEARILRTIERRLK